MTTYLYRAVTDLGTFERRSLRNPSTGRTFSHMIIARVKSWKTGEMTWCAVTWCGSLDLASKALVTTVKAKDQHGQPYYQGAQIVPVEVIEQARRLRKSFRFLVKWPSATREYPKMCGNQASAIKTLKRYWAEQAECHTFEVYAEQADGSWAKDDAASMAFFTAVTNNS